MCVHCNTYNNILYFILFFSWKGEVEDRILVIHDTLINEGISSKLLNKFMKPYKVRASYYYYLTTIANNIYGV